MKRIIAGMISLVVLGCSTDKVVTPEEQLKIDVAIIDKYITDNSVQNVIIDPNGLRLVITQPGSGASPSPSNIITVKYIGRFLSDGKIFDQNQSASGTNFGNLPLNRLIVGWQIGFSYLKPGSKATLFVPSGLAYGTQGSPPTIPSNSNLMFDVELISFK